jgi:prepilin-type processing-associated H-X9-DG protein
MRVRTKHILIGIAVVSPILLLTVSIVLPLWNRSRHERAFDINMHNMHQIGLGILVYCNDHQGQFPDSLATLVANGLLSPTVLVDPNSNDTPAEGKTPDEIRQALAKGGHQTYIYLGRGMTDKSATADTLVAYEPLEVYENGSNALFGDGHTEWITPAYLKRLLSKPATSPATAP